MVDVGPTSVIDNINNVIGSNASESDRSRARSQTNYQDFLKLLTTQLQNQDPSEPADTNQLTQQIATLSQVEQQINTNQSLEQLITLFSTTNLNSVVSYIGKQVEANGDKGSLQDGNATFIYHLEETAASVDVNILDDSGLKVFSADGTKIAGRNEVLWDGIDSNGKQLEDGTYTINVTAKDAEGEIMDVVTSTVGIVNSVETSNGNTTLRVGDVSVDLGKIRSVSQPVPINSLVSDS